MEKCKLNGNRFLIGCIKRTRRFAELLGRLLKETEKMLKFTKYGKAASAKSFSNNAFNEKPEVVLTSYKVTPSTNPEATTTHSNPCGSTNPEKVDKKPPMRSFIDRPKVHLERSKVSKEELMKLDFGDIKLNKKSVEDEDQCDSGIFGEAKQSNKPSRKSTSGGRSVRRTLSISNKMKVPVYNDGYFPKVPPLSKCFSMKTVRSTPNCYRVHNAHDHECEM